MAHRRKSSHPMCKQKRISSVVDRVLAAKLQENETKKILYNDLTSTDNDTRYFSGSDSDNKHVPSDTNIHHEASKQERERNIAIPDDLLGEFQALKKATNMDTATLMRKLMHDYSQLSEREKTNSTRLTSQLFDVSIRSSEKDKTGLANYYDDRSVSPGEIVRANGDKCHSLDAKSQNDVQSVNKPVLVQRNPSPARVYSAEPYYWSDENYPNCNMDNSFSNGYRNSMKVPTVIREQNSDSSSEDNSVNGHSRSRSRQSLYSPSMGSDHSMRNSYQESNVNFAYADESPEHKPQLEFLPTTPIMDDGSVQSAYPLVASLCDENGVIISPKQNEETTGKDVNIEEMKFAEDIISQTDAHMAMQALNPHGITAKLQKASGKNNNKKGQMKLIAENTSHHGVYTSVLKLPWSRRTRTPKNDPAKNQEKGKKHLVPCDEPPMYVDMDGESERNLSPPFSPIKHEPLDEHSETPKPLSQPQMQQPLMLVPVSGMPPSSQNGIFVPTNSLPMMHEAQGTPPMMMVYPNSSFANVGRPARKRGRPPKVPVLTRMLSDTSKVPRFDFPVTNFFPQFGNCHQPAIVLNVNNMMNTGSVGNATNNTNANVNTTTATNVLENNVQQTATENKQQDIKENKNSFPVSSAAVSLNVPVQAQIYNMAEHNGTETSEVYKVAEQKVKAAAASLSTMTTTTSIANIQSGAIYQEMILSSKALVNVRPRKRQSTTELLKSKSTKSNDFICTSFKLRNVNKQHKEKKKVPWVPGMKRRGRPPKKKMFSMMEGQVEGILNPENFTSATIHHFPPSVVSSTVQPPEVYNPVVHAGQHTITTQVSPTSASIVSEQRVESDSNDSTSPSDTISSNGDGKQTDDEKDENNKDMFQQLFHCKICNDIVPVEKRDEHREKHVQMKFCCNKCELTKTSYIQRDDIDKDESIDKLFKCEDCTTADDTSSVSLVCVQCNERFLEFSSLNNHKQNAHPAVKDFSCPDCEKTFINYQKFKLHQQLCHVTRYHSCPYQDCQKTYTSPSKLQNHIQKRHENKLHLRCIFDDCNEKFFNHASLKDHIQSKHYSVKRYTCSKPGCNEEFTSERHLKFHLLLHNDSDMCTFECEICDYRCHQQHVLDWHMKNLHPETVLRNDTDNQ